MPSLVSNQNSPASFHDNAERRSWCFFRMLDLLSGHSVSRLLRSYTSFGRRLAARTRQAQLHRAWLAVVRGFTIHGLTLSVLSLNDHTPQRVKFNGMSLRILLQRSAMVMPSCLPFLQ